MNSRDGVHPVLAVNAVDRSEEVAEVFAGITFRAAKALKLFDRGVLKAGNLADFIAFNCNDYREILYHQGELQAEKVWKKGCQII